MKIYPPPLPNCKLLRWSLVLEIKCTSTTGTGSVLGVVYGIWILVPVVTCKDKSQLHEEKYATKIAQTWQSLGEVSYSSKVLIMEKLTNLYYIPKSKSNITIFGEIKEHGCKIMLEDG
jgi:hypothetical protein